jgi:hypothetical protein
MRTIVVYINPCQVTLPLPFTPLLSLFKFVFFELGIYLHSLQTYVSDIRPRHTRKERRKESSITQRKPEFPTLHGITRLSLTDESFGLTIYDSDCGLLKPLHLPPILLRIKFGLFNTYLRVYIPSLHT